MTFQRGMFLGGIPAGFMLVSTIIGLGKAVPNGVAGALQHFAAGVLLCTVGSELLPEIMDAQGLAANISALVGFFLGVTVLILLGLCSPANAICEESGEGKGKATTQETKVNLIKDTCADDSDSSDSNDGFFFLRGCQTLVAQQVGEGRFMIAGRKYRTLRTAAERMHMKRSMSLSSLPLVSAESRSFDESYRSTDSIRVLVEDATSGTNNKRSKSKKMEKIKEYDNDAENPTSIPATPIRLFPMAFVLAVAIDSSLDGLLIGIASAAGPSAGPMMSASLSVEMSFLGLTLATTLYGQTMPKAVLSGLVGPFCLVLAAGLAGALAEVISHSPVLFVGMLSFGASALLFMVSEELLLDAHEDGEHLWWVDLQLYTGFFASIIAGKFAR